MHGAFREWEDQRQSLSLGEVAAELRSICVEEDYVLEAPPRHDRVNTFTGAASVP
jgi:hypothetical protein